MTTYVLLKTPQKPVNRKGIQASCLVFESHSSVSNKKRGDEIRVHFRKTDCSVVNGLENIQSREKRPVEK